MNLGRELQLLLPKDATHDLLHMLVKRGTVTSDLAIRKKRKEGLFGFTSAGSVIPNMGVLSFAVILKN